MYQNAVNQWVGIERGDARQHRVTRALDIQLHFAAEDEILTLSHSARDRGLFARGAVAAARWVAGHARGQFDMQDVLGLKT